MYSTSSSFCNCGTKYDQEHSYEDVRGPQFYSSLGRPLVYYAKTSEKRDRQSRSQTRKGNPNFFLKAFRWYTQEQNASQRSKMKQNAPDWSGFATWLDVKYKRYLQENRNNINVLKLEDTTVLERSEIENRVLFELRKNKIFSRMRSPWKKRKRVKSKEDNNIESTSATCCSVKNSIRTITQSQSCTDSRQSDKEKSLNGIEVVTVQEGVKSSVQATKRLPDINHRGINCNYDEEIGRKLDAQTQYEQFPATTAQLVLAPDMLNVLHTEKLTHDFVKPVGVESRKNSLKTIAVHRKNVSATCQCPNSSVVITGIQPQQQTSVCQCPSTINKTPSGVKTAARQRAHESKKPVVESREKHMNTIKLLKKPFVATQCNNKCLNVTDVQSRYHSSAICQCFNSDALQPATYKIKTTAQQDELAPRLEYKTQEQTSGVALPRNAKPTAKTFVSPSTSSGLVNNTAQTSEHAIILDTEATHTYPLLVKIIAVNK